MARTYTLKKVGSGLDATVEGKRFHIDKHGEVARHDGNTTTRPDVNAVLSALKHSIRTEWVGTVNAWAQKNGL